MTVERYCDGHGLCGQPVVIWLYGLAYCQAHDPIARARSEENVARALSEVYARHYHLTPKVPA